MDAKVELSPTDEQLDIINLIENTNDNILVNALAGTGKTTTLDMIQAASPVKPVLCLAFNKRIAEEMQKRFPDTTTVRTFNSLGHRIWAKSVAKLSFDPKKTQTLMKEAFTSLKGQDRRDANDIYWDIYNGIHLAKALGYVPDGKFPNAKRLITAEQFHAALDEKPTPFTIELIDSLLLTSIKTAYEGLIDYNDQIYMPALFGGTFPRFPLVLVDEAQDLNPTNHAMLDKLVRGRVCAVGDPWQCHPPDTRITVTGVGQVPIERLVQHQQVAAYSTRASRFAGLTTHGREIEQVNKSHFSGNLIVAQVGQETVKMTPNHRCIARIDKEAKGHVLYLMRKGDFFRLGTSRIKYGPGSNFGPSMRARQEKADAVWLLDILSSPVEAHIMEQAYSIKFGIPTLLFESLFEQDKLDSIWDIIGSNISNGLTILSHFGRDINLPIWTKDHPNFIGFHRACTVHATNLMSKVMSMLTFPTGQWQPIEISKEAYVGDVYGITVEPTEGGKRVYFANNVLVHNSIYGFRGSVQEGMAKLKARFAMHEQDLSISFRCPKAIVEAARWRVPHFKWVKDGGRVHVLRSLTPNDIPNSATIICRNNAPLFRVAFGLLSSKRSVSVAGSEIGPRIIRLLQKIGADNDTQDDLIAKIDLWKAEKLANSQSPGTIIDMAECMKIFATFGSTLSLAVGYAEHLFKQQGTIRLMTGHKAKGGEWDTVYHLDPWLIGDDEQELNLRYVITTRAKESLYEIDSKDIRW